MGKQVLSRRDAILPKDVAIEPAGGESRPATIFDLILYLLAGFGLFLLASAVLSNFTSVGTPADSAWRYLLNLLFLGGAALVLGVRRKKVTWQQLGLALGRWRWKWLLAAVVISILLSPLRAALAVAVQLLFGGGLAGLQERSNILTAGGFTWPAFLLTLLGVGILVPFSEELYFRGLLFNWFRQRLHFWPSVLLSAGLFGLGHFDSIGVVISSFIMGLVNAIAYERTGSLWLPVAIHAVTNSLAVILIFVALLIAPQ